MGSDVAGITRALAEAAGAINSSRSLAETLDSIAWEARRSVPGFNHAGISIVHRDGRIETMAGTDQLVWKLDTLQYELDQGPCVDAIRDSSVVVVEAMRHQQRWPRFTRQAAQLGLRAQMGLRLYTDEETLGGLNLYSTESEVVDPDAPQIAELFAAHAAIALGRSRREEQLNVALLSRKVIGQAVGIVMERYQIGEDRAFHFLVRASSTSNLKLRMVAQEVVDTANQKFGQEQVG